MCRDPLRPGRPVVLVAGGRDQDRVVHHGHAVPGSAGGEAGVDEGVTHRGGVGEDGLQGVGAVVGEQVGGVQPGG